jgi:cytochrome c-type biogenesis protein CcmH
VAVRLADHLKSRLSPDDTVFVFARSLSGGPPMPLAVVRRRASELPFEVTLDDSMAMTPQHSLSSVDEVRLVARVSKSGTAQAQSGDLQGEAAPVKVGTPATIPIWISSVVP